jgi:hypothetical protein
VASIYLSAVYLMQLTLYDVCPFAVVGWAEEIFDERRIPFGGAATTSGTVLN